MFSSSTFFHMYHFLNKIEILLFSIPLHSQDIDIIKSSSLHHYIFFENIHFSSHLVTQCMDMSYLFTRSSVVFTYKASPGRISKLDAGKRHLYEIPERAPGAYLGSSPINCLPSGLWFSWQQNGETPWACLRWPSNKIQQVNIFWSLQNNIWIKAIYYCI